MREGLILLENRIIGSIDIEILEEEDHRPPLGAFDEPPPPMDGGEAEDRGPTFRPGIGPGTQRAHEPHRTPVFRGRGTAGRHKHIQPHYTRPDHTRVPMYKPGEHPHKPGPVFRPRSGPGVTPPSKPEHITLADVHAAVERTPGGIDRSQFKSEDTEATRRRAAAMVAGEVYPERASPRAMRAQLETAFNRATRRGHSLEQALWDQGQHGQSGYYPTSTYNHGEAFIRNHPEWYERFKREVWAPVMAGSDEAKGFTGNASAGLAERQKRAGTPTIDLRSEGGDQYFNEPPFNYEIPRLPGVPHGVTHLPADPNYRPADRPTSQQPPSTTSLSDDMAFLSARGGHSTIDMRNVPLGSSHAFNPEFAARLAAAGRAYEAETGQKAFFGEGDRDVATQAVYYQRYLHGGGIAAPPGRSRHQSGDAMDLPSSGFREWLKGGNMQRFGIHFPVRGDAPHAQLDPSYSGPAFYGQHAAAEPPPHRTYSVAQIEAALRTSDAPPPASTQRPTMLFLHGMQSRYQGRTPASIEEDARALAEAKGMNLEVINVSGDRPQEQERLARQRMGRGGISEVFGFSAGGYTAGRLRRDFPNVKYTVTGAPGVGGDVEIAGVKHMDLPHAVAAQATAAARAAKPPAPTSPQPTPPKPTAPAGDWLKTTLEQLKGGPK